MATTNYNKRVVNVKPTSIAMIEGLFAAVVGLAIAILFSLRSSIQIAESTQSVLTGLTFGIAGGAITILVLPLIYFGIGWLVGLVHGYVLNFLIEAAGGLDLSIKDNK